MTATLRLYNLRAMASFIATFVVVFINLSAYLVHATPASSPILLPVQDTVGTENPLAFIHEPGSSFGLKERSPIVTSYANFFNHAGKDDFPLDPVTKGHCAVKKYAFNHEGIVTYNNNLPELSQFTICFWTRYTNHTGDHVLLTYSAKNEPRIIQFWIANRSNSSFVSMALKGQQIYRLNYPLRMRQWHHMCSSWNGNTGEWQVWAKAERIGRGFHNALVGYKIKPHGILYSGGVSVTDSVPEGLHFEITMVQIYRIALSAGKAHKNHKHHHVHRLDHEGREISTTTKAPPMIARPVMMNGLLVNGQLPSRRYINFAQLPTSHTPTIQQQQQVLQVQQPQPAFKLQPQQLPTSASFIDPPLQLPKSIQSFSYGTHLITSSPQSADAQSEESQEEIPALQEKPINVAPSPTYVDETEMRIFFKRETEDTAKKVDQKSIKEEKAAEKRTRRDLSIFDGASVDADDISTKFSYNIQYQSLADFGNHIRTVGSAKFQPAEGGQAAAADDPEPAEDEVRAVMEVCSTCDLEPFKGAVVFEWKHLKAQPDNALEGLSVGGCGEF